VEGSPYLLSPSHYRKQGKGRKRRRGGAGREGRNGRKATR
tara:strand:+ start:847 stop:966 length:120 start_codon:yes stop_codon:yes gene_type:complete